MKKTQLEKTSSFFDYNQNKNKVLLIWQIQNQLTKKFKTLSINEKCIFLVGDVNVGKTTLLYYLSGLKLKLKEDEIKKTKEMQPQQIHQDAIVSNTLSTTQIPNVFSGIQTLPEVSLIDMPGMNDNRYFSAVSNLFKFEVIFQKVEKIKKIHIVYVISEQIFDYQQIKQSLLQFTRFFNVKSFQQAKHLSFIFTKTKDSEDDVKQKFFQYLEQIKEQIEDQEEKEMAVLIDIILELKQKNQIIYCFPKEDPVKQKGEEITQSILSRDEFIQNDHSSILNQNFVQNFILSSKQNLSDFENNLIQILYQENLLLQKNTESAINFAKLLHKNHFDQLFKNQQEFQKQAESFFSNFYQPFIQLADQNKQITPKQFIKCINFVCEYIIKQKFLCEIDQALKNFFTFKNSQILSENKEQYPSIKRIIYSVISLNKVFKKIMNTLQGFKQTQIILQSIKRIDTFLGWLTEIWYSSLNRIKSLDKIKQILMQNDERFETFKSEKWIEICENKPFINAINEFSSKVKQLSFEESEEESEVELQNQQIVQNQGYIGKNIKQLKQKYFQVKNVDEIEKLRKNYQQFPVIDLKYDEIDKIVSLLQQQVLETVIQFQSSKDIQRNPEKVALVMFQMKNLRHKVFVQSALKNFISYLKYLFYIMRKQNETNKLSEIINKFVHNICQVLEEYSLFQQEVLFYMFVNDIQQVKNVIDKGFASYRIEGKFILESIVPNVQRLATEVKSLKNANLFVEIVTKCYNHLISQQSSSRQQQSNYQKQFQTALDKYFEQIKLLQSKQPNHQDSESNQVSLNYFILEAKSFSIKNIREKIKTIEQRNSAILSSLQFSQYLSNLKKQQKQPTNIQKKVTIENI